MAERTVVLLKPDSFERGLAEEILDELEEVGEIVKSKKKQLSDYEIEKIYGHLKDEDAWPALKEYMSRGKCMACLFEGENILKRINDKIGRTRPEDSSSETIRGKYGIPSFEQDDNRLENLVHSSLNCQEAQSEEELLFGNDE